MQESIFDVLILGGGPSGLTAAIYTSRAMLNTLVVAGNPTGGQLTTTTEVENFPGFTHGIQGPELVSNMRMQAERFGTSFVDENVLKISGTAKAGFVVETDAGNTYKGRSVIVATGATAKWLGLESEQRLKSKGVSACATCDGFFFKNKVIAVVGGGDAAMEEATFLTKFASKVYVLIRNTEATMKASKIMKQRAMENSKIQFVFSTEVKEVLGTEHVEGLKVFNSAKNAESVMSDVQGLFVAIGHEPNTKFLNGFIELDQKGYIKSSDITHSTKEGVFVAGDVADYRYRQAITAAGLGCMASLDVIKFLAEN